MIPRQHTLPDRPTVHRDIFYFRSRQAAIQYARRYALPVDRIIEYQRGWAIQLRVSGPYAGNPRQTPRWYAGRLADDPGVMEVKKVKRPMMHPWDFVRGPFQTKRDAVAAVHKWGYTIKGRGARWLAPW